MAQKEQHASKNSKKKKGAYHKTKVETEYQKERAAYKRKKRGAGSVSITGSRT